MVYVSKFDLFHIEFTPLIQKRLGDNLIGTAEELIRLYTGRRSYQYFPYQFIRPHPAY